MNKIYKIEGMTCASCKNLIESESEKILGIKSIQVNFASESANLNVDEKFNEDMFFELLISLGYRANINPDELSNKKSLEKDLINGVVLLIIGSILMSVMLFIPMAYINHLLLNIVQLILCIFILLFFGKKYLLNLFHFFKTGISNMHTLIAIGVMTSFIYSLMIFLYSPQQHLYVESIPFILGFTFIGQYFEKIAKTKAQSSLSSLYKMQIKFAIKIQMVDGYKSEVRVPVVELKVGDIIKIFPGEKIPLNGEVIEGESHLDESLISGESIPIAKKIGSKLIAGSINLESSLIIKVVDTFHDSFVSNIIKFVENAESKKTSIEKYTDKIVRYFVPFVILFSILTGLVWFLYFHQFDLAIKHFIAVLVIACPCALGLAVPMSVMISTREAAKIGLLINGGEVIEKGSCIDTIVFDKTGTLTIGKPKVENYKLLSTNETKETSILQLIGSGCAYSTHPLSQSILEFINSKNINLIDPDKFKNIPGGGFSAQFAQQQLLVGSYKFLFENDTIGLVEENELIGSKVYIAINNLYKGYFLINDQIKLTSIEMIKKIESMNIEVWMLTGDNLKIAKKIGRELGISNIKSDVTPEGKAQFIIDLKNKKKKVAMVGDGINDAPALMCADLSIAMANGSDVAISSSEVSLLDGTIDLVPTFFKLSKNTMSVIRQNLFFSFVYNILCIPIAAGAFYSAYRIDLDPRWASISMGLSSTSVILSSLRLKKDL